ncbi:MAG TPA: hypothetical protein VGL35_08200 [Rhizomicrobium sp.]|jgi:sugar lactone lactonase YvrE
MPSLSPFGLTIDPARDVLWTAAASIAQRHGATAKQRGRSAILAYGLGNGSLRAFYRAPGEHAFNDLVLAPDGAVYVTDSQGGVFRLRPGGAALEPFGDSRSLVSSQGIPIRADNRHALVADYARGLQRLDLTSGAVLPVAAPDRATTPGIDGLAPLADGSFVATRNPVGPMRIVRIHLAPDWSRVTGLVTVARATAGISDLSLIATGDRQTIAVGVSQWASLPLC